MKVGDMVMFESDVPKSQRWEGGEYTRLGIIVAELPIEGILNAAVSVLWASGELVERVPRRILAVINGDR